MENDMALLSLTADEGEEILIGGDENHSVEGF